MECRLKNKNNWHKFTDFSTTNDKLAFRRMGKVIRLNSLTKCNSRRLSVLVFSTPALLLLTWYDDAPAEEKKNNFPGVSTSRPSRWRGGCVKEGKLTRFTAPHQSPSPEASAADSQLEPEAEKCDRNASFSTPGRGETDELSSGSMI